MTLSLCLFILTVLAGLIYIGPIVLMMLALAAGIAEERRQHP